MLGGKPPEFFHDWRFLLVGLRCWMAKVRGCLMGRSMEKKAVVRRGP